MAQKNITYEGLQKDSDFLSSAYHSLIALGENPSPNNPKEIVDTFLTKRRWFNANLGATVNQSRTILNDFSPDLLSAHLPAAVVTRDLDVKNLVLPNPHLHNMAY